MRLADPAVFLGRFVAFFRAVMPALARTSRMRYRVFLAFNAAGGLAWGLGCVALGHLAGNSYATVERTSGAGWPWSWPSSSRSAWWCGAWSGGTERPAAVD